MSTTIGSNSVAEQGGGGLTESNINPSFIKLQYAVRGPIVERALELEAELKKGTAKLPFTEVVRCNIGDMQATGQLPITYLRELVSIVANPDLAEPSSFAFSSDVIDKAMKILANCGGSSSGSYTHSLGIPMIRQAVADYIAKRDGLPSNVDCIFLSCGASEAIKINYYLDESNNWALPLTELERAIEGARDHCRPRALIVINPGNPTGQVLTKSDMEDVIKFAVRNDLVLLADEVYQFNIYQPEERPWISFKKVLAGMGPEYADKLQLASFMSCSKGFAGECGARGGYCELVNFKPEVRKQLYKVLSSRLCPPVFGQVILYGVVCPPEKDQPSYAKFNAQREKVLKELAYKANLMSKCLDSLPGVSCNPIRGAMYAFPRIRLPKKAIEAAKALGQEPDFFYCLRFLEEKGVCVVPGSGFGQQPGTFHFRTTILPKVDKIEYVVEQLKDFHIKFMTRYTD